MILVLVEGTAKDPTVTTPDSVDEKRVSAVLGPLVPALFTAVQSVCGLMPVKITVAVQWIDGTVREEKAPDAPSPKVPSWMS